jgi:ComF family protein
MRGEWLCDLCEGSVPSTDIALSCRRCGVPRIQNRCGCSTLHPSIYRARSAFAYDGWVATSVKRLKYEGEPGRAQHLGLLMMPLLAHFGSLDGLVPVPLHPSKERARGFNQAVLLVEELARQTGVPLMPLLQRAVATESQTKLSGEDRRKNVHGVFVIEPGWQPRPGGRFLLVDDVRTTGATLGACASALRAFRPTMIGVATFALDLQHERLQVLRRLSATSSTPP